ncbi:unnamed protein product [Merluccius merluccius]
MGGRRLWILNRALLCFFIHHVGAEERCPASCLCARESGTVACRDGQDAQVPDDIPGWASTLILRGNRNVTTLPRGAFSRGGGGGGGSGSGGGAEERPLLLVTLWLSHNGIRAIEACAFAGLSRLHLLDLSHNPLASISAGAFYGLPELRSLNLNQSVLPRAAAQLWTALGASGGNGDHLRSLHRLDLAGNGLRSVPPLAGLARMSALRTLVLSNNSIATVSRDDVSSGLARRVRMRVYLSLNPFRCDCALAAFCRWLRNSSQCADSRSLVCSEPEARRGVPLEDLGAEDGDEDEEEDHEDDCANENLEAVSYVFLGLVLALIGVVFLMVLYLNRGGIKRWLNNIREACRDQMEVYHYRYEQDSDPRLANVAV